MKKATATTTKTKPAAAKAAPRQAQTPVRRPAETRQQGEQEVIPPERTSARDPEPSRVPAKRGDVSAPAVHVQGGVPMTALDGSAPAFMRDDSGKGTEHLGRGDLEMPRLKLIQGLSPELETVSYTHLTLSTNREV